MQDKTIIRKRRRVNFTNLPNHIFQSGHLSYFAQGLLCNLLSKPDDWRVSIQSLCNATKGTAKESGEYAVRGAIKELIAHGYIQMQKLKTGHVLYIVSDEPDCENCDQEEKARLQKTQIAKIANSKNHNQHIYKQRTNTDNKEINNKQSTELALTTEAQIAPLPKTKKDKLQPDGVSDELWIDYKKHRQTKKATISQTSIKLLASQAEKAGISISEAMEICIDRGWTGFRADWYQNSITTNAGRGRAQPDIDFNSTGWLERARQNDPLGQFDDVARRLNGNTRGALK